jgi:hypothetical protein
MREHYLSLGVGGASAGAGAIDWVSGIVANLERFQVVGWRGGSSDQSVSRSKCVVMSGVILGLRPRVSARLAVGIGASGPPGPLGTYLRMRGPNSPSLPISLPTDGASPGVGVMGAAAPRHQGRGGVRTGSVGEASTVDTSGLLSCPHLQGGRGQRLRARIGAWQIRHTHMQNLASRPHWPPPGLMCGHIFTIAVLFPQVLEVARRPSRLVEGGRILQGLLFLGIVACLHQRQAHLRKCHRTRAAPNPPPPPPHHTPPRQKCATRVLSGLSEKSAQLYRSECVLPPKKTLLLPPSNLLLATSHTHFCQSPLLYRTALRLCVACHSMSEEGCE